MKFGLKKYMTCGRVNLLLKKLESLFFKGRRRCKADKKSADLSGKRTGGMRKWRQ